MSFSNNFPTTGPSLELDFANVNALDPRITFTRSSIATVTNSLGLLQTVQANVPRFDYDPVTLAAKGLLIEEQRTNLLTYSEQFDNAAWAKSNATITPDTIVAPDGTLTADKLIESNGVNRGCVFSTAGVSTGQTLSVYAKAGEWTHVAIGSSNNSGLWAVSTFNLSTGATAGGASYGGNTVSGATITAVGNGWYRCSVQITALGGASFAVIMPFNQSGDPVNPSPALTGNGTSGIFIWGAQLEAGSFATSYIPSTTTFTGRSSTGTFIGANGLIQTAASGVARYQYNPANLSVAPFLLLEAAATNLILYSDDFGNAVWNVASAIGLTVSSDATTAPDGTSSADKLVETATNDIHQRRQNFTSGTAKRFSIYAKAAERTIFRGWSFSGGNTQQQTFNLANGTCSGLLNPVIQSVGNGWFRCSFDIPSPHATVSIGPDDGTGGSLPYNGVAGSGLFVWGAQLEDGSYATSYIPTVASQVTRAADTSTSSQTTRSADVASVNTLSPWYNATEGTLYAEGSALAVSQSSDRTLVSLSTGTAANTVEIYKGASTSNAVFYITNSSVLQAGLSIASTFLADVPAKSAGAYKTDDIAFATKGATPLTDSLAVIPTMDRLGIGSRGSGSPSSVIWNGHIRRITYYPIKLSSAQLQAITT